MNVTAHSLAHSLPSANFPPAKRWLSLEIIEQIRQWSRIENIIGEHVRLRLSGRVFVGPCLWHASKSKRSFVVYPERQSWRCWSCGFGGDVFEFIERLHGIGFRDAVGVLAQRCGIQVDVPISAAARDRIRWQAELSAVEQKITAILDAEFLRVSRQYGEARKLRGIIEARLDAIHHGAPVRFRNEQELAWMALSDVYAHLRLLDVEYCILAFATQPARERFLTASPEHQKIIVNQVLEDGFVRTGRGHPIEVPL